MMSAIGEQEVLYSSDKLCGEGVQLARYCADVILSMALSLSSRMAMPWTSPPSDSMTSAAAGSTYSWPPDMKSRRKSRRMAGV